MVKEGIIVNQVTIGKGLLIPNLNRCLHGRKKFCIEVGAMSWERFVEAKKNLYEHDKAYNFPRSKTEILGNLSWFSLREQVAK
ncbi:hypothetical protein Gotur_004224 [Gossypium turneri]